MEEDDKEELKKRSIKVEPSTSLKHIIQTTAKILRDHTPHEKKRMKPLKERAHLPEEKEKK